MKPQERLYLKADFALNVPKVDYGDDTEYVIQRHIRRYELAAKFCRHRLGKSFRVLDIACGSGYGSFYFEGCDYVGVDNSGHAIAYANKRYGHNIALEATLRKRQEWYGKFYCADAVKIPTEIDGGEGFDAIISIETLEHLPKERQPEFIKRVWELLKSDGIFYFTCPISENGEQSGNPHHLYEPMMNEIMGYIELYFGNVKIVANQVLTTAGVEQKMGAFGCTQSH